MNRLTIVAVGGRRSSWARQAEQEYCKRLGAWGAQVVTIKPGRGPGALADEARRLRARVPASATMVALKAGRECRATDQLAADLERWVQDRGVAFLVGGADGLDAELVAAADATLSLSPLTLAHDVARVVLLEQCYRCFTILAGHPYHRG